MISTLRLQNFRCFDAMSVDFPSSGAVIVGANAQGKTSILEAVCVLVRLHSPRSLRLGKMIKMDTTGFGVAGECWGNDCQVRFSSRLGVAMKVDDEPMAKQVDYLHDGGLIVWMGNDDLELVRGSGRVRRRYLDFLGCQLDPAYRDHLNRYQRVLKLRNLLLKDRVPREAEISAYTELFVRHGEFLTQARRDLVELLAPEVSASQVAVSACSERVGLEYVAGAGLLLRKRLRGAGLWLCPRVEAVSHPAHRAALHRSGAAPGFRSEDDSQAHRGRTRNRRLHTGRPSTVRSNSG